MCVVDSYGVEMVIFASILTFDRPLASSVTAEVPRPKMVLGLTVVVVVPLTVVLIEPPLRVMVFAPALVLSVNLKLCVL